MSNIRKFKNIADENMRDIIVSKELKEKTLMQCSGKRHISIGKFLVPAACFILILGIVGISGILPLKNQTGEEGDRGINLMRGTGEGMESLPGDSAGNMSPDTGTVKKWSAATPDEAKKSFGSDFLTPSYIPESFKIGDIQVSGPDKHRADIVVLNYLSGNRSFLIIQEKTEMQNGYLNLKKIDINGTTGYLKPGASDSGKNTDSPDTEIHWFKNGVHYSVMGLITEDEAIKVAASMK